jgi:hypothetical protein
LAAEIIRPLPTAKAYLLIPMIVHRDAAVRLLLSNFSDQFFFLRVRRAILRAQGAVAIIIKLFWLLRELAETPWAHNKLK